MGAFGIPQRRVIMWKDPIVEEIHAIRRQIAKECNYDLEQVVERLRKKEKNDKERLMFSKPGERTESQADS